LLPKQRKTLPHAFVLDSLSPYRHKFVLQESEIAAHIVKATGINPE
jgi:hypothetical protein